MPENDPGHDSKPQEPVRPPSEPDPSVRPPQGQLITEAEEPRQDRVILESTRKEGAPPKPSEQD